MSKTDLMGSSSQKLEDGYERLERSQTQSGIYETVWPWHWQHINFDLELLIHG